MLGASHSIVSDCDTMDCIPAGFSVHGILQTKIPEWVAIPFSEDLPEPGIMPKSSYYRQILYHLNDQGSPKELHLLFEMYSGKFSDST